MRFGPKNEEEARIFAFEELRADIQYAILRRLKEAGMTQAQLAKKLGKSPAWISQILGDDANLTLETVAEVFLALGSHCHIASSPVGAHYYDALWNEGHGAALGWSEGFIDEQIDRLTEAVDTPPMLSVVALESAHREIFISQQDRNPNGHRLLEAA